MKNMKKILALVLAALMLLGMTAALADPAGREGGQPLQTKKITLTNPSAGHTYTLYQIFTGTFKAIDGKDTLGNIAFGDGLKLTDGKYDGKTAEELAKTITNSEAGARAFANTVDGDLQNGNSKSAAAQDPTSLEWTGLSEGYYIIKDTTANLPEGDEYDLVVVQVLDDVSIKAKAGTVEFDKKVKDRNDSTQEPTVYDEWGHTSDYDVGDDVPYQVTIKLPANFSSYETYSATVHDKMDAGLSLNDDSIEVYVGESTEKLASGYTLKKTELPEGETFEIVFADVKALTGVGNNVTITVYYTAKLTGANVVYGNPGNKNEAWLTYSNNPTTGQEGGTTPRKTTVTFTYKLDIDKVDQDKQPLDGAAFELYKSVKKEDGTTEWKKLALVEGTSGTKFTFDGLDDGFYKIVETETPAGYNSIADIYFTVTATHSDTLTELVVKQADQEGQAIDTDKATAKFDVTLTKTAEKDSGLIETDVQNMKGVNLPSTGGMGTTLLYVGGSILVVLAAILLITKRRMSSEE